MELSTPMEHPEQESVQNGDHSTAPSVSACKQVGIDDLPDEILRLIIRRVGTGDLGRRSQRDLFNLGVCSRRFFLLTEPELYSDFRQEMDTPEGLTKFRSHLLLFLRRILARPDLARSLRRLRFSCSICYSDPSELGDQDWARIRRVVDETGASEDEAARWTNGVQLGRWAAVTAVLLSVAPNLEELEMFHWCSQGRDKELLFSVFGRARNLQDSGEESPLSMSRLRSVSVNFYDFESGYGFGEVWPFLELKSVQAFRGHMVHGDRNVFDDYPRLRDRPLKLSTKELEFRHSNIDHNDMGVILGLFPQLERLSYEYDPYVCFIHGCDGLCFEPKRMMAALTHLQSYLKDLTFITPLDQAFCVCYDYKNGHCAEGSSPIGSLAGFQKLVSITAQASIMIGEDWSDDEQHPDHGGFAKTQNLVDAVPPTLELLALEHCKSNVVRHIFELVSQKPWRTPALRKLDLGWERVTYSDNESPRESTLHPGFTNEEAMELMAECEAADIEIVIQDAGMERR